MLIKGRSRSTIDHMEANQLRAIEPIGAALGSVDLDHLSIATGAAIWRGPLAVDDLAISGVGAATALAATFLAERNGRTPATTTIDARHAAAAFQSELLVAPVGWTMPPVWDPIAGDYRCDDGWIRLHTNYPHHRAAALRALDLADTPELNTDTISDHLASRSCEEVERAIVAANGVAGRQRCQDDWRAHDAGRAVRHEPLVEHHSSETAATPFDRATTPFEGIRVLDLTRVLAGPTATSFLAGWGADVLRIDPPGFPEVPAILPITTAGKHCAALDLTEPAGRDQFLSLLEGADIIVHGYRSNALRELGLDPDQWSDIRPGLVDVSLDAYGWTGPWSTRRGFDSIVQHSVGITAIGQHAAGSQRPVALPCQALDHGAGWLVAAAATAGLLERQRTGHGSSWRTSLARVADLLLSLPRDADPQRPTPTLDRFAEFQTIAATVWGPLRRLAWPGAIGDLHATIGPAGRVARSGVSPDWPSRPT